MLKRTGKYDQYHDREPAECKPSRRIRKGRIAAVLAIIGGIAIGIWFLIVAKSCAEAEIERPQEFLIERRAVNILGDAEIGYIPRESPRPLSIEPVVLKYDRDRIAAKIPRNRKGEPLIGPSVLVDYDSLRILWSYRSGEVGQIASMTKMMLLYVTYALVDSGAISLFDTVYVTDEAPLMGGSQAYLDRGERYTVSQLLGAVAICSANDAAYLLADYIGCLNDSDAVGVAEGVKLINDFAERLGLEQTKFFNAHGLPPARSWKEIIEDGIAKQRYKRRDIIVATKANTSTPIEMAKLGIALCKYPRLLRYTNVVAADFWDADSARVYGSYRMNNHFKPIASMDIDGIKTGYTSGAGYCVTASAERRGRRLIAVVFGAKTQNLRDDFVVELFETAFDSLGLLPDSVALDSTTISDTAGGE